MQYCALKGYLRRVRDYRISLDESIYINSNTETSNGNAEEVEPSKPKPKKILRDLCDGTNDSDSLACQGYSKST